MRVIADPTRCRSCCEEHLAALDARAATRPLWGAAAPLARPVVPDCCTPRCDLSELYLSRIDAQEMTAVATNLYNIRESLKGGPQPGWKDRQLQLEEARQLKAAGDLRIPEGIQRVIDAGIDEGRSAVVRLHAAVSEAMKGGQRIVLLWGKTSSGKTVAAAQWLTTRVSGVFALGSYVTALRPAMREDRAELDAIIKAPSLVLDDCGPPRCPLDAGGIARLSDLICARADEGRWTVLTCEKPPALPASAVRRMRTAMCETTQ